MGEGLVAACSPYLRGVDNLHPLNPLRHTHLPPYQAPLSLSRQTSCARHPAQDTVETRHLPTRPQHDSHAPACIHSSCSPFTIATRFLHVSALHTSNRYICTYLPS